MDRQPTKQQSRDRRATMTTAQRADLERLSIVTQRFWARNERMARGLTIGFRNLESESVPESKR